MGGWERWQMLRLAIALLFLKDTMGSWTILVDWPQQKPSLRKNGVRTGTNGLGFEINGVLGLLYAFFVRSSRPLHCYRGSTTHFPSYSYNTWWLSDSASSLSHGTASSPLSFNVALLLPSCWLYSLCNHSLYSKLVVAVILSLCALEVGLSPFIKTSLLLLVDFLLLLVENLSFFGVWSNFRCLVGCQVHEAVRKMAFAMWALYSHRGV